MTGVEEALNHLVEERVRINAEIAKTRSAEVAASNARWEVLRRQTRDHWARLMARAGVVAELAQDEPSDIDLIYSDCFVKGWKIACDIKRRQPNSIVTETGIFRRKKKEIELSFGASGTILTDDGKLYQFEDVDSNLNGISEVRIGLSRTLVLGDHYYHHLDLAPSEVETLENQLTDFVISHNLITVESATN